MAIWLMVILASIGSSVITCLFMEAYFNRRASDHIGEWE